MTLRPLPLALAAAALLATSAAAQRVAPAGATPYTRAIAAGYKAAMYCSAIFTAGRTPAQIDADELTGIYPEYDAIVPTLTAQVDREHATVTVAYDDAMRARRAEWTAGRGCVILPPGATAPADAAATPRPRVTSAPPAATWPQGNAGIRPRPSPVLGHVVASSFADAYGARAKTTGVVVVHDGRVVAERYAAGWDLMSPAAPGRLPRALSARWSAW